MLFRQRGICPGYLAGEALTAEMGFLTRTLSAAGYIVHPDEEEPDRVIEALPAVRGSSAHRTETPQA
jgi:hypothetical protein